MNLEELTEWPLYINDRGVVYCGGCDFTFEEIGRRTTVKQFLKLLGEHAGVCREP